MAASVVLVGVGIAWIGDVAVVVAAAWFATGFAGLARAVERAVPWLRRFRRSHAGATDPVAALVTDAADLCGVEAGAVDRYVLAHVQSVNAYAHGGHGLVVTGGFATAYLSGRLSRPHALALIAHELGHLNARATRFDYPLWWWTLPWRIASTVVAVPVRVLTGWLPGRTLGYALAPVVGAVATLRLIHTGQWAAFGCVAFLGYVTCVLPLLEAAVSRHGEYAADDFASRAGLGDRLAEALAIIEGSEGGLLASHPSTAARIRRLHRHGDRNQESSSPGVHDSPVDTPGVGEGTHVPELIEEGHSPCPTPLR